MARRNNTMTPEQRGQKIYHMILDKVSWSELQQGDVLLATWELLTSMVGAYGGNQEQMIKVVEGSFPK